MGLKQYAAAAGVGTVLVVHSFHQPESCPIEKLICQEPEQKLPDIPEPGRPGQSPTGPTLINTTTGPTGPIGSANIVEGPDSASGSVTLNVPTAVTVTQS
jgi:hypothetical protein